MRDPITRVEAHESKGRVYLRGQLLGPRDTDWRLLAVFDSTDEIDRWCDRAGEHGPGFRDWFKQTGFLAA